MSKIISARFSTLDVDRLEKLAMSKEMIASEVLREIVTDYFEKQKQDSKFEQINEDVKLLHSKFRAVIDSNIDLVKGFREIAAIVQQKQGA
jgi:hypothetical protein